MSVDCASITAAAGVSTTGSLLTNSSRVCSCGFGCVTGAGAGPTYRCGSAGATTVGACFFPSASWVMNVAAPIAVIATAAQAIPSRLLKRLTGANSGSAIATKGFRHWGHLPLLPMTLSRTAKENEQAGQTTSLLMDWPLLSA